MPTAAGPIDLVVAERPGLVEHGDSFLLPLTDPAGADGINRDVAAHGEPLWSWHVTGFEGFGDFGVELLDGWPTYVEQDVRGWIANTCGCLEPGQTELPRGAHGHIGFWNYTVGGELERRRPSPSPQAL